MKAYQLSRSETLKEIRRLNKNLSARLQRIEGDENLPQFAVEGYKKLKSRTDFKNLENLTDQQLTTLLRDVRYISDLKSANVRGAKYTQEVYLPIKRKLESLSPNLRGQAFKAYERIIGEVPFDALFKYEIVGTATDYIYGGQNEEDIIADILPVLTDIYEEQKERGLTNEEARVLAAERLKDLLRQFE